MKTKLNAIISSSATGLIVTNAVSMSFGAQRNTATTHRTRTWPCVGTGAQILGESH
jgi:hypothetical protein